MRVSLCLFSWCFDAVVYFYIPTNASHPNLISAAPSIHSSSTVFLQTQVGLPEVSVNQGVSNCSLGSSSSFKAWWVNPLGRMGPKSRHQRLRHSLLSLLGVLQLKLQLKNCNIHSQGLGQYHAGALVVSSVSTRLHLPRWIGSVSYLGLSLTPLASTALPSPLNSVL